MEQIAAVLEQLQEHRINVIDVGCHTGRVTLELAERLKPKEVYSIGIDPVFHAPVYKFTHFVQVAIRNCPPKEATLHHYSDPMCNSLLPMTENVTHDASERNEKWFGAHDFERLLSTSVVPVMSLSKVLDELEFAGIIHVLKIDAQGLDLEVFLSLGNYISKCLFIQMETITSGSKDMVLYPGQSIFEDEIPILEKYGYRVFYMTDYKAKGASPEGDVIYANTSLVEQAGITLWQK